jgi:hypothetical protein
LRSPRKVGRANARSRVVGRGSGLDRDLGFSGVPKGALGVSNAAYGGGEGRLCRARVCVCVSDTAAKDSARAHVMSGWRGRGCANLLCVLHGVSCVVHTTFSGPDARGKAYVSCTVGFGASS